MILRTERLTLRPLAKTDVKAFVALAGDIEVARMTSDIPHPLDEGKGLAWLAPSRGEVRFAIEMEGRMIGSAGYFKRKPTSAELGFWLGRGFWGAGLVPEAAVAIIRYGFDEGGLAEFTSSHFIDNPASERVLAKLGFEPCGRGRIWCSAREAEVIAVLLELPRARAEPLYDLKSARPRQSRLGALFERVRGA